MARNKYNIFHRWVDLGTGRLPKNANLKSGRYIVIETIGAGGMGAVYLALDTAMQDRPVAIKEMRQADLKDAGELQRARERFQQEANMLRGLSHPNLPQVYDSFLEGKRSYLVMEYIQGQTLNEALKQARGSALAVPDVIKYGLQLCDVLAYLHTLNPPIVFRDLKPLNIMVKSDGSLYLIDFGIARFFQPERQSRDTEVFVSRGYSPPEQHGGVTTPRSDLFSLGATLHHCLTGQHPLSHTQAHPFQFPPIGLLNRQVPLALSKLVERLLAFKPEERPPSAQRVQQELQGILAQSPDSQRLVLSSNDTGSPFAYTYQTLGGSSGGTPFGVNVKSWLTGLVAAVGTGLSNSILRPFGGKGISSYFGKLGDQVTRLFRNQKIWHIRFVLLMLFIMLLSIGGSVYLAQATAVSTHFIGLILMALALCTFCFYLSKKHLPDTVPRVFLGFISLSLLLSGLALQALPDMDAFVHTALQTVTLGQVGAIALVVCAAIALFRPSNSLLWMDRLLLGLLAGMAALLQYAVGSAALAKASSIPSSSISSVNLVVVGILASVALFILFRVMRPFENASRVTLLLVAGVFTFLQYTLGWDEFQHFLAAGQPSVDSSQHLVLVYFLYTLAPPVCAFLALLIREGWMTRIALTVLALAEATMFVGYLGQNIDFPFLSANPYPFDVNMLASPTWYQLIGPALVFLVFLTLLRLPRGRIFNRPDHGALLVGALICARLNDAFWQTQAQPVSANMNQSTLQQEFTFLAAQIPTYTIYILLFCVPLLLMGIALCHLWKQSHPYGRTDIWLKRLRTLVIRAERVLVLMMLAATFLLQGFAGTLNALVTSGPSVLIPNDQPDFSALLNLGLLLVLAIMGIVLLVRLFSHSINEIGNSERFTIFLATLLCLLLLWQNPAISNFPLLTSRVQLTGNLFNWPAGILGLLFVAGLLIVLVLAFFWLRRSFFADYRELLKLALLVVMACALLQFIWPVLLPVGLIVLIPVVLLTIQIEQVG